MKRTLSIIGLVFVLVLSCLCVVGCGDDDSSSASVAGRWVDNSDGSIMVLKDDGSIGTEVSGTFQSYGTYKTEGSNFNANIFGQEVNGTYSLSGDNLTLTMNGKTYNYTRAGASSSNQVSSSTAKTKAATVDAACKDYYASVMAGVIDGVDLTTKAKRNAFLDSATINDALSYSNVLDVDLSELYVESNGTIVDNSSSADTTKTALLSNPNAAGSLRALYA